ncbi:outer membrane protein assembly factor BamB family protein [Haladaptatus sp. NG-SE-30]
MVSLTRRKLLATGAAAVTLVSGCLGPNRTLTERPTGEWRHRAHDARNTGATAATVPPRGTPAWDSGEAHIAAPLVADGTVYSVSHEVTALDAKSGDLKWESDLDGKADYTPALLDDILMVAAGTRVVGLDRSNGDEVWSTTLPEIATGEVTTTSDPGIVTIPVGD